MGQDLYFAKHNISWEHIFVFPKSVTGYSSHKPIIIKLVANTPCFLMYVFVA